MCGAARTWLRPPGSVTGPADLATTDGPGRRGAGDPRPPGGAGGPGRVARRYRPAQRLVRRLRAHITRDPPRRRCGPWGRRARRRGRGGRPRCIRRAPGRLGAGPAGAATAILLAEHGVAVQLLDRARFPRPKICGEYLSPEAPRVLDRLGVLKTVDGLATPLAGMRITAPDGTVVIGTYRTVGDWRPYREHAMAIERARLDEALVERVRTLPIDFREHVRVTDVLVERGEVRGVVAVDRDGRAARLRARLVIAADGRASVVAERLGLRHGHRLKRMALVTYVSGLDGCRDYGAGFVDPFTGEGIYAALRGAELAVETAVGALRSGDCSRQALAAYRRARRLAFGGKARVTRALQFVISHRGLANLTAHVLAQRPG